MALFQWPKIFMGWPGVEKLHLKYWFLGPLCRNGHAKNGECVAVVASTWLPALPFPGMLKYWGMNLPDNTDWVDVTRSENRENNISRLWQLKHFITIYGRFWFWFIFFRWVETTKQISFLFHVMWEVMLPSPPCDQSSCFPWFLWKSTTFWKMIFTSYL